jgi:hypothetical protein
LKLELIRKVFTDISTIGDLLIDGKRFSYALEDKDMQRLEDGSIIPWSGELKIPGETAIPYGTYEVITDFSNRFKRVMPLIKDVPGFAGVRIHTGNTAENTEGCLLLGYIKNPNFVGQSKKAFDDFFPLLKSGLKEGKVWLTISAEV